MYLETATVFLRRLRTVWSLIRQLHAACHVIPYRPSPFEGGGSKQSQSSELSEVRDFFDNKILDIIL